MNAMEGTQRREDGDIAVVRLFIWSWLTFNEPFNFCEK